MITKSGIKLGIALPQGFPDAEIDADLVRRFAVRAEALGFDDLWTLEQITGRFAIIEPLTLLSYVAALTSSIRLGVAVIVVNLRNPVQLAKMLSSLDQISAGRLTVGVGLGTSTSLYPAFGLSPEHAVSRFIEGLKVIKALWTEGAATIEGDYWHLEGVAMQPKPVQRPLPLWFGARSPGALKRAVRFGQGWMGAGSETIPDFLAQLTQIRELMATAGRPPEAFTISKRVYLAVGKDGDAAIESLRRWIGACYGDAALADRWAIWGTASECLERLAPLAESGLDHLMLNPVAENLDQLEIIAADIAPKL